jgi:triacylglycerol esterase/lipase EstA (alpha/beta hydrolase family)
MGIRTPNAYVKFFIDLNMGNNVTLLSFLNNEKIVLKHKMQNKEIKKEPILEGLKILEELSEQVYQVGEKAVLEKYGNLEN